jgi:transposase
MDADLAALPDDIDALRAALTIERSRMRDVAAERDAGAAELAVARAKASEDLALIAHQKLRIAKLERQIYGPRSERSDRLIDQLALQFEELEASATEDELAAEIAVAKTTTVAGFTRKRAERNSFPEHLPRERVVIDPPTACECCGGTRLRKLGEDVTRTLETIPRQWKVIETVREKFTCRDCEKISQAPAPFHVIARGWAGASLLAMILFEKFGQHQPLNRQAERYALEGVPISLSTMADAVGSGCAVLDPVLRRLEAHVLAAERLHGDDTTVPVLAKGKTDTGRCWVYVRDDRPFGGTSPPAAMFYYSRDRKGEHPQTHLAGYAGLFQADAFDGYRQLYLPDRTPGPILEAGCWVHARRPFFAMADVEENARRRAAGKKVIALSPIAIEVVRRIDALFEIERPINGKSADQRRVVRQQLSKPLVEELRRYLSEQRAKLSRGHDLAKAIDYILKRWAAFTRFLDDGRVCLSNNAAERALRGIATRESLCTPSSSIWKHWKLILSSEVTRATFTPDRRRDGRCGKIRGEDLERRAGNDLLGAKYTGFDQLAYPVAGNAALLGRLAQGQPGSILLGRLIGVNVADAPDGADPVCRPGLALSGRQSHPVEGGSDILVGPAARHAANDRQGLVGGAAFVFAGAGFTQPKFGVLAAFPMDDQNNLPSLLVDVDDDVIDEGTRQLLAGAHRDAGVLPCRLEVLGDGAQVRHRRRRGGGDRRIKTRLAVADAA